MHSVLYIFANLRRGRLLFCLVWTLFVILFFLPRHGLARIYVDINAPSVRKFKIAVPDFKNLSNKGAHPDLAAKLAGVISNDLAMSGYFNPLDKGAFLEGKDGPLTLEKIRFKNWSVIGAELLLRGGYTCTGNSLEVEVRLFDVFRVQQAFGKRGLGDIRHYRYMMHRLANEIIRTLTGHDGVFTSKLTFVGNASGHKEIYICDYDGHNVQQITKDKSIALMPRWSPKGKKILYNSYKEGGPMLYLKDITSGAIKRVSGRSGLNTGASWAPGGGKVALTLSHKGDANIFTIDLNGRIIKQLTAHSGTDVSPAFSPDGNKIAFVSSRSGSPQIYVHDQRTGREERLTYEGKYNASPAWSALNRIAFASRNGGLFDIFTIDMNANGGGLRRLTANQGNNEDPWWSPDGRYLVFSSNREGRYHLYMMDINGQNQRRITSMKGDQTAPCWAP